MSAFIPLKRSCPVCDGARKDCRQNKQNDIVHCRADLNIIPSGWKALGQDKWGFEMYAPASDEQSSEDWHHRQREQQAQRQRELEELRRGALPESERDTAIRRIHRYFGISSKHRQNLRDRGLCDSHIDRLPYFSFAPNQPVPQFTPANLPGVRRGKLAVKESGFACPIPSVDGTIIGWQNRFDNTEGGKYRWPRGEKSSHLPNGELPIGVYRPDSGVTRRAIGHSEGFLKADIIAQLWGLPTLGAASANFSTSPTQWRLSLDQLSAELGTKEVRWFADAAAVKNPNVTEMYQRAWEKLTSWGYLVWIIWYGQTEKSVGDADEISQEVRESARLITIDEYLAIAKRCCEAQIALEHGAIRQEPSSYTAFTQNIDRTVSRDEWELKFGFGQWLKRNLKSILGKTKGFAKEPAPVIHKPAPPSIIRYPDDALPVPTDYEGRELPRIIFKKGKRLEVLVKLRELGWKYVCDRSFTGSGKSHEAGLLYPDPDADNKIWYFDLNHTNPSTETIETKTNMPPRHNGMVAVEGKFTPRGQPHLKWATADDIPVVRSLCHNSELFIKLKSKGWEVDDKHENVKTEEGKSLRRNPICKGCQFSHKCHEEVGAGYGYLAVRLAVLEERRIRSSIDSAPNPYGDNNYDYSLDTAFVEEASRYLRSTQSLSAGGNELAQLWGYVERKAPDAFAALQPIRFALQDALSGKFDRVEKGINRGADHETLIENLPPSMAIANLPNLIFQVEQAMPTIKDVVEEPDSVTGLGGQWRSTGQFARDMFKAQAAYQTRENIEALPPNVLVDALKIWAGLKPGSLRLNGKQLHVTVPFSRHVDVLDACKFVVLLDATPNTQYLEKILGDSVLEIEEERPPLSNLTIFNVHMKGMGSNQISDSCKSRQVALLEWIKQQHQEVKVLANKADSHLPLDGWWFNDNRGSNAFKGVKALAAFNVPRPNLGVIQDEYRALFGSLERFEQYYQQLIESEIVQLIGRPRAHQYPEKQFSLYLTSSNQDLSFLTDLGCRIVNKEAFQLTPLAGTAEQITRWKILQAVEQLQDQGEKLTQEAIATLTGKSQALISKVAKSFGGWAQLKKLLLALLGLYRGGNNFTELTEQFSDFINGYLSPVIDTTVEAIAAAETQSDVQAEMDVLGTTLKYCAKELGWRKFLQALAFIPAKSQANLLSVLLRAIEPELEEEIAT